MAQSAWDPIISNSYWYVTAPQMLAYANSTDSFASPMPIGDQTLWALGTSVDGIFTGTSSATLKIGPITSATDTLIDGKVTPSGQITMVFTPTTSGPTTIGLGQMQEIDGITTMEMQMITGTSVLISHWAYMTPYDPAVFTPPEARVVPSNLSPQWAWVKNTPWRISSPELFGSAQAGTFIVTGYKSGYFWGAGIRPDGTRFTLLGSITPEGRVLFNTLTNNTLTSLYGGISGTSSDAEMLLGAYDDTALFIGDLTATWVVRPYVETVAATGTYTALGAAQSLYGIAGTVNGLYGAMSPVMNVLNSISGAALSSAISQTVPVLSGAATQATANSLRMLGQVAAGRAEKQDIAQGEGATLWATPLGGAGRQNMQGNIPGYDMKGGGFVLGADKYFSPDLQAGVMASFSWNDVTSMTDLLNVSMASGNANLHSYVFGGYGSYVLMPGLDFLAHASAGLIDTETARTIGFMGTTAKASYQATGVMVGAALRGEIRVDEALSLLPAAQFDYLSVNTPSYQESGAGPLNLLVQGQSWQELMLGAELTVRYQINPTLTASVRGGAAYDALGHQDVLIASFEGGGLPFGTPLLETSPWLFTAGVCVSAVTSPRLKLDLQYDMQASPSGYLNQIGAVRFALRL
ncbi:MAG: autotransporter outer membrane beta-barrel domain-containing protein [Xanthobacter sp.]